MSKSTFMSKEFAWLKALIKEEEEEKKMLDREP